MARSEVKIMRGFTLIELAVVIGIVALLLGALLVPLATQIQGRNIKETRESLADIKEALMGYAMTQGRLPCPDTTAIPDGREDAPCGTWPQSTEGFLPYLDLGVPATDAWGRVFRYAVASEFTYPTVPGAPPATGRLDLSDASSPFGFINVETRGDDPGAGGGGETKEIILLTERAPAAVLSVGSNGFGGTWLDSGGTLPATVALSHEEDNVDSTPANFPIPPIVAAPPWRTFVQRQHTPFSNPCSDTAEGQPFCEYDDLVIWLSAPVLFNRLVEARQLP
jgi:prepilin-type N-terminal cleavage/methylation domain-containing protein